MGILIKNGTILDPVNGINGRKADILVEDAKIVRIAEGIPSAGHDVFDAAGSYVVPGLIDMHCHLREPGREDEERIQTGTRSAAMGGLTAVAAMPNTNPVIDSLVGVKFVQMLAAREGAVNVHPIAAITKRMEGEELTEIGDLTAQGVVGISDDGLCVMNAELMRRALEYAKMFDIPVIQHSEDKSLAEGGAMHEGAVSIKTGLKGIPSLAEEIIVSRDIQLSRYTGGRLHVAHVSTKGSVELIRQARKQGVPVTCEATPHHFTLTHECIETFDSNYKVNPPLRSKEDVEAIIEGLRDGTIDAIASDHAPHTVFEKEQEFDYAPCGMIGFETMVPLVFTELVHKGRLTAFQAVEKLLAGYAILNIRTEGLREGGLADITVIDPGFEFVYRKEDIVSKSCNSPFLGRTFRGAPVLTMVRGRTVMKDRKILL
jgi:dihydroorotase